MLSLSITCLVKPSNQHFPTITIVFIHLAIGFFLSFKHPIFLVMIFHQLNKWTATCPNALSFEVFLKTSQELYYPDSA
jgi:hypothetical protein